MSLVYLADLIVAIHLAFVGFVVLGQLAILVGAIARWHSVRNFWFRSLHLIAMSIVVVETVFHFECPLTTWERDLLHAAGQSFSDRTFIGRLTHSILIYEVPANAFDLAYYTFGAIVLVSFMLAPPRWPFKPGNAQTAPPAPAAPEGVQFG